MSSHLKERDDRIYRFGEFELEPGERRLAAAGKSIALTPKVFDTLVLLVESAGRVAAKDDLMKALWPRGYVDEATLSNHIWQIRRALGDTAKSTRFIETVPKVGYRFAAPVKVERTQFSAAPPTLPLAQPAPASADPVHPPQFRTGRRWTLLAIVIVAAASALILALFNPSRHAQPGVVRTVALIGFTNLSRDTTDAWVAPALAAMLGTELSSAQEIRLVPDSEVKDAVNGLELPVAGGYSRHMLTRLQQRLDADVIVSGSYLVGVAAEDSMVRIDLALQDAHSGELIAALSRQERLSALSSSVSAIGVSLRAALGVGASNSVSLERVAKSQPPTTEVARRVGLALQAMEGHDAARARDELLEVVALAPGYGPAYLYLSRAWTALGFRKKALAAAEQANQHGDDLTPEQRLQVAAAVQTANYDWSQAATSWKSLISLKPQEVDYWIACIDAQIAANELPAAQTTLTGLRSVRGAPTDPRVALAAARVAAASNDPKAAATAAADALNLAHSRDALALVADASVQLGGAWMHLGKNPEARTILGEAIADYQTIGNPHGETQSHRLLAQVLANMNLSRESQDEYQRAMAVAQRVGDEGAVGAVYRDMTQVLWVAGDVDGAKAAATQALRIARETGDLRLQAWTLRALAMQASDEAQTDQVLADFGEVAVLTEESKDPGGHVWSLASYADALRIRGRLAEALDYCNRARQAAQKLSDSQFIVFSEVTCGQVLIDRGETNEARMLLETALKRTQASKNTVYEGITQLSLAQLEVEQGLCPTARDRLRQTIQEFAANDVLTGEAVAHVLLAMCAQASGNSDEFKLAIERARTLRAKITSRQEVYFVDIMLAELANDTSHGATTVSRLQQLAADAERRQFGGWALEAKLAQWRVLRSLGDKPAAHALGAELRGAARRQGFGRILKLMALTEEDHAFKQKNAVREISERKI